MKHLAKRTLSLLLAALMVLSLIPASTHVHATDYRDGWTTGVADTGKKLNGIFVSADDDLVFVDDQPYDWAFELENSLATATITVYGRIFTEENYKNGKVNPLVTIQPGVAVTKSQREEVVSFQDFVDAGFDATAYGDFVLVCQLIFGGKDYGTLTQKFSRKQTPAFAPTFNDADYKDIILDSLATPALTVTNPHETLEMTALLYATLKKDGVVSDKINGFRVANNDVVAAGGTLTLVESAALTKETSAEGAYELDLTGTVTVDGTEYPVEHTVSFTRRNTLTQRFYEQDGDLYYAVQKVNTGVNDLSPNNFRITITGGDLAEPKVVTANDYVYNVDTETTKNLTKDVMSDLAYGTYTVTIEAAKDTKLRSTVSYVYTYAEPVAFAPEFNDSQFATVYDSAALANLFIRNPHETAAMTTNITLTIKKGGVALNNANEVPVKTGTVVEAGANTILVSSKDLSDRITEVGVEYEIVLGGTVTVDTVEYPVNHTITITRQATFEQRFFELNGVTGFGVKLTSDAAAANAPKYFKFTVIDSEDNETGSYVADESVLAYTTTEKQVKMTNLTIVSSLQPGTYTLKAEAYKNEELTDLRGTVTCEYIVAAPECEHPNATDDGDCTTAVVCPDCEAVVTPALEHDYTNDQDASCNNEGCNYVRYIHYGSNVTLGNSIDVNVTVSIPAGEKDQHKAYIQVAGGEKVEVEMTQNGTNFCDVTLPGLAAKDLYKEINVTVCDENGEEVHNVTESFAAYAERLFKSEANENDKKMIADMVAYAVAAQNYFLKNTNNSVIAQLEEAGVDYTQYTDNVNPTCTDERAIEGDRSLYQGSNFDLEDEITMNMYVRDVDYAVIEYIPYNGTEKFTKTIQASECEKSNSYYKFKIDGFVTADGAHTVVTAKFFVNGNDEPVVTVTDSMESYVARQGASLTWLYTMQKYANSAYAALTD